MKRVAAGRVLLLVLFVAAAPPAAQEAAPLGVPGPEPRGAILVTAVGVRGDQGGSLLFALFRGPQGWLKQDQAFARQVVPARPDSVQVRFASVPFDTVYAVQVVHDKNGNGKFDLRTFPFPKPKEGGGVSNNHTRMGPPQFAKARFALDDSLRELRVIMRY
jgi:uncharacterized protein (DUF2141 family)